MTVSSAANAVLAKARAMYGKRLTAQNYTDLLACRTVNEAAAYLKAHTAYADAFEGVTMGSVRRRQIEILLREHLLNNFASLCRYEKSIGDGFYKYFVTLSDVDMLLHSVRYLNSRHPEAEETLALRQRLSERYGVPALSLNVKEMGLPEIQQVFQEVLYQFPLREIRVSVPGWLNALDEGHWLVQHVLEHVKEAGAKVSCMRDQTVFAEAFADSPYTDGLRPDGIELGTGRLNFALPLKDGLFNRILGEECGTTIEGDAHLLRLMKELVAAKSEYDHVADALRSVRETGYGLVTPTMSELTLQEPEIVQQGSRFGVRLKANAPSLHLIRVDIETEVSPVVGTEKQSEELVKYLLEEFQNDPQTIWNTNFFGKSLHELVREGLANKLMRMPVDAQEKVQETLSKIINEGNGGMICILL